MVKFFTFYSLLLSVLFSSCGFFERSGFSENEIKNIIFGGDLDFDEQINTYSFGGVGGRIFIAKIIVSEPYEFLKKRSKFKQTSFYLPEEMNRELLIKIFNSKVQEVFAGKDIPKWISNATCDSLVSECK